MSALAEAEALLQQMASCGISLERRGRHLWVTPKRLLTDELRASIRERRQKLLQIAKGERDTPCPHDVLERAAFLEFCEGLDRAAADEMALGEFGFTSWEALASAGEAR